MTNTTTIDYSLDASWILPVVPHQRVFKDCSLLISRDRIHSIVPTSQSLRDYNVRERISLPGQLLMPGLINCHGHAAMTLLRGFADDMPLETWLKDHIWPVEAQWAGEEFVRDGGELAMAEMLLSGTTCFADMYFFGEALASAVHKAGMRAQLYFPIVDFPTAWAQSPDEYIHKGLKLRDTYRSHPLINVHFGPHAPYTLGDAPLERIAVYADELQAQVHIHLHETAEEIESSIKEFGKRPLQRLADIGLLTPLTHCVHMTQTSAEDIALLANSGAHVIHCPRSNLKLASGSCPAAALTQQGVNVALGTDGAASNNSLDMFAELQAAALFGKLVAGDAAAIDAHSAIRMATINGAKAIGLEDQLGSLEPGKQADVIAIDMNDLDLQPVHNPVSQLVYTQMGHRVSNVWVAGEQLVKSRDLTTLSRKEIAANAAQWREKLGAKR
ncbi:TRZ/ATZ family hydrolase [Teredinibacter turnerae]|uniref:TRZ/ATZ family hydrolase n=1 Tax=Teredinibacter turnerae TaxID=2426 RepID=UPI00037BCD9F|nr:TRZ/ATZ family hydrolase [Teredinibacter turnerae]